jgi:hypothetical protein
MRAPQYMAKSSLSGPGRTCRPLSEPPRTSTGPFLSRIAGEPVTSLKSRPGGDRGLAGDIKEAVEHGK